MMMMGQWKLVAGGQWAEGRAGVRRP
jgi:hypothetical protein